GTIGAGLAGGFVTRTAGGIALYSGVAIFVGSLIYLAITLHVAKLPITSLLQSLLTIWLIGIFSASVAAVISGVATPLWPPGLKLVLGGLIFLVTFGVGIRVWAPERMLEGAEFIPTGLRAPFLNLMRLSPGSQGPR